MKRRLTIRLTEGSYKSIGLPLEWSEIPPLAVLTGQNGTGKTQFLESLHRSLVPPKERSNISQEDTTKYEIVGATYHRDEVAQMSSEWHTNYTNPVGLADLQKITGQVAAELLDIREPDANSRPHAIPEERLTRLRRELSVDKDEPIETLLARLPDSVHVFPNEINKLVQALSMRFYHYYIQALQARLDGHSPVPQGKEDAFAPAPWVLFNEVLATSGLRYSATTPEGLNLQARYHLRLRDRETDHHVSPAELSSGEKALFSLLSWIFTSSRYGDLPSLLLLDEPDSHLHTAQVPGFLQGLQALSGKYGCQVIMTTHRPDTIALAPSESVFEMSRIGYCRIRKTTDPFRLMATMTAQLIDVLPSSRCVFVEDTKDVDFYTDIVEILVRTMRLPQTPVIRFMTPALGKGSRRESGGSGKVRLWVRQQGATLPGIVSGVVDRDSGSEPEQGIRILPRYSIENYIYDPLLVLALLVDEGVAEIVHALPNSPPKGQGHAVVGLSEEELQGGIDTVCRQVALQNSNALQEGDPRERTEFRLGNSLRGFHVPRWANQHRGHSLAGFYQQVFKEALDARSLGKMMNRIEYVPEDLVGLLMDIVGASPPEPARE